MTKIYRPDGWEEIVFANCSRVGGFFNQDKPVMVEDDKILFEAGAEAMWKGVSDYIADLSKSIKDDKMFRVKLFLWLTSEEQ